MDRPTVSKLLADENLRRETAARVIPEYYTWTHSPCPRPWSAGGDGMPKCLKCGATCYSKSKLPDGYVCYDALPELSERCPVPDPARGSEADIAEALLRVDYSGANLGDAVIAVFSIKHDPAGSLFLRAYKWFGFDATPAERIVCCLLALGEAVEDGNVTHRMEPQGPAKEPERRCTAFGCNGSATRYYTAPGGVRVYVCDRHHEGMGPQL